MCRGVRRAPREAATPPPGCSGGRCPQRGGRCPRGIAVCHGGRTWPGVRGDLPSCASFSLYAEPGTGDGSARCRSPCTSRRASDDRVIDQWECSKNVATTTTKMIVNMKLSPRLPSNVAARGAGRALMTLAHQGGPPPSTRPCIGVPSTWKGVRIPCGAPLRTPAHGRPQRTGGGSGHGRCGRVERVLPPRLVNVVPACRLEACCCQRRSR